MNAAPHHTPDHAPDGTRAVPRWMRCVLGVLVRANDASRIAPAPTGSQEIPAWLLALLVVLTIAALALFAPGAKAGPADPIVLAAPTTAPLPRIDCQGTQEDYFAVASATPTGASEWWTDCGYRYELPGLAAAPPLPPVIDPPTTPVPEPAIWLLFIAGLALTCYAKARRHRNHERNREGKHA